MVVGVIVQQQAIGRVFAEDLVDKLTDIGAEVFVIDMSQTRIVAELGPAGDVYIGRCLDRLIIFGSLDFCNYFRINGVGSIGLVVPESEISCSWLNYFNYSSILTRYKPGVLLNEDGLVVVNSNLQDLITSGMIPFNKFVVKPDAFNKRNSVKIYSKEEVMDAARILMENKVHSMVFEHHEIKDEYRFMVASLNNRICGSCQYVQDGEIMEGDIVPEHVAKFLKEEVLDHITHDDLPKEPYVVYDVCELYDGRLFLLEVNSMCTSGWYSNKSPDFNMDEIVEWVYVTRNRNDDDNLL